MGCDHLDSGSGDEFRDWRCDSASTVQLVDGEIKHARADKSVQTAGAQKSRLHVIVCTLLKCQYNQLYLKIN